MVNVDIIEKSLQIALRAHAGQKDKAGKTYLLHPLRVMSKMESPEQMSVALLHDVIEDSSITASDLLAEGLPASVVDAVQLLSKNESDTYEVFIERLVSNKLAARVKLADIEDNINILRLTEVGQKDFERLVKYHAAWKRLVDAIG